MADRQADAKRAYFERLSAPQCGLDDLVAPLAADCRFHAPHPINDLRTSSEVAEHFWAPLLASFPDLERRTDILLTGEFSGASWMASTGYFIGLFERDWLGIPATRKPAWIRYGWFDRLDNAGLVSETFVILDIPGVMMQAGAWPLSPPLGLDIIAPGPATRDGVDFRAIDPGASDASLKLVQAMIAGLMQYDGENLASMGMRRFWTDSFHWYGPAPIGTMRGHADYERGHQRPFLRAFPDRVGGDHKCRIGEGAYVASTGWPSVRATHSGGGWLGTAPTGRRVEMRVMDFWRRQGAMLAENWVFIDLPHLLLQMDLDVFARMGERLVIR